MTPDEAIAKTREMVGHSKVDVHYMSTLENGWVLVKVVYDDAKHIGQGNATYIFDSNGSFVRREGGK